MPKRSPNQLALTDAKKLARLSGRPDQPLVMKMRVFLLERLYERREWLWQQIERHVEPPLPPPRPDERPAHETAMSERVLLALLDKIAPSLREHATDTGPSAAGSQGVQVKIYNVNRGTKQARDKAIEVQAQRRTAATARVIESAT